MKKAHIMGCVYATILGMISISSHAALIVIDNGEGLIYDTVLDVTWSQPDQTPGGRNWNDANAWAAGLTLGGGSDWRLPYGSVALGPDGILTDWPVDCSLASEMACRDNELGYMFYHNLGGTLGDPLPPSALFPNILPNNVDRFWFGQDTGGIGAYTFIFDGASAGSNGSDIKGANFGAWAVHDGNVIPEPASVSMLLLGAVGMAFRRFRR